jgi:CheY-like chemotaxis protein
MSQPCVICVIDDDENDRFFLKRALDAAGVPAIVREFEDAETAWHYLKGDAPFGDRSTNPLPDMIIADSALGNASGLDLLQWVRVHPNFRNLPFIVYSGSPAPTLIDEAVRMGVTAILLKSVAGMPSVISGILSHLPSHCKPDGN